MKNPRPPTLDETFDGALIFDVSFAIGNHLRVISKLSYLGLDGEIIDLQCVKDELEKLLKYILISRINSSLNKVKFIKFFK